MILSLLFSWCAFAGGVHTVELRGSINPGSAAYVLESLAAARADGASLFVIKLDTPGGLIASTRTIIQGFSDSPVPVVVWVTPNGASATSAGALIALGADVVAMQDGTNMGAAHPVGGGGEDIQGVMGVKITNDTAALARAQATLHGRNVDVAAQLVTHSKSFSAGEAVENHLADFIANDLETIIRKIDGKSFRGHVARGGAVTAHLMTPKQTFLNLIADPNVSAVLFSLGGLALWAEVSSGFSSLAAGIVGSFCFILGLISLQTLPITTGGALLLILGFGLLVIDAFVTNHGALSVAALICLLLGGLFLIDPGSGSMHVSLTLLLPMLFAVALVLALVGYVLSRDSKPPAEANALVGATARVSTVTSHRAGTAYVNGEIWTFVSDEPAHEGEELVVVAVHDLKIQLKRRA